MCWRPIAIVAVLLVVALSGCTTPTNPFQSLKDPVGNTTFLDAGSNATDWRILVAGRFQLPSGTRFWVSENNTTCETPALVLTTQDKALPCGTPPALIVTAVDQDASGQIDTGDLLIVRTAPGRENRTFDGPLALSMALHPSMPLFVLDQDYGRDGPVGRLKVELFGE